MQTFENLSAKAVAAISSLALSAAFLAFAIAPATQTVASTGVMA